MDEKNKIKRSVSYKWLKLSFIKGDKPPNIFWIFPKKHIPLAVTRNRLKRWGRLFFKEQAFLKEFQNREQVEGRAKGQKNFKKKGKKEDKKEFISGDWLVFVLKEKKNFYKNLKRKEFDHVFKTAFESLFFKF